MMLLATGAKANGDEMITFKTEYIGAVPADRVIYRDGKYVGLIESPATSGRKTWRVILEGRRVGDFKTVEDAETAVAS